MDFLFKKGVYHKPILSILVFDHRERSNLFRKFHMLLLKKKNIQLIKNSEMHQKTETQRTVSEPNLISIVKFVEFGKSYQTER